MEATLQVIDQRRSSDIYTFWFKPERLIDFVSGQFVDIYLPHQPQDNRSAKRTFTIYSSPTEELLGFTTRITAKSSSFKRALKNAKLGLKVKLSPPMGDFILPINTSLPLVFIAGGIGITPFRSIMRWLKDTDQTRNLQLIHFIKNQNDIIDQNLMKSFNVQHIVDRSYIKQLPKYRNLMLEASSKRGIDSPRKLFYISGAPKMVRVTSSLLLQNNIEPSQIVKDSFLGYEP